MKSDNQAHTYEPKISNILTSSESNRTQNSEIVVDEINLAEAIEDFNLMAKVEGQSDKTLKLYEYAFNRLTGLMSKTKLVTEIQVKDLRKYLASLMDDGLKKTTVAIHYRHLKSFFNWLVEENYLEEAPTEKIDEPKTPKKFPRVLDGEQVTKLLTIAKNRKGEWSSYRNYFMLVVFVEMGLRLNELINAKIKDLDLKNRSLKVHGKGAKDRKVYFGKRTLRTLRHWMKIRDYSPEKVWDDTIFISQGGEKLKVRNVEQLVSRIQKKSGTGRYEGFAPRFTTYRCNVCSRKRPHRFSAEKPVRMGADRNCTSICTYER